MNVQLFYYKTSKASWLFRGGGRIARRVGGLPVHVQRPWSGKQPGRWDSCYGWSPWYQDFISESHLLSVAKLTNLLNSVSNTCLTLKEKKSNINLFGFSNFKGVRKIIMQYQEVPQYYRMMNGNWQITTNQSQHCIRPYSKYVYDEYRSYCLHVENQAL